MFEIWSCDAWVLRQAWTCMPMQISVECSQCHVAAGSACSREHRDRVRRTKQRDWNQKNGISILIQNTYSTVVGIPDDRYLLFTNYRVPVPHLLSTCTITGYQYRISILHVQYSVHTVVYNKTLNKYWTNEAIYLKEKNTIAYCIF